MQRAGIESALPEATRTGIVRMLQDARRRENDPRKGPLDVGAFVPSPPRVREGRPRVTPLGRAS